MDKGAPVIFIVGGMLDPSNPSASLNLAAEIGYGFEQNGATTCIFSFEYPKDASLAPSGEYRGVKYELITVPWFLRTISQLVPKASKWLVSNWISFRLAGDLIKGRRTPQHVFCMSGRAACLKRIADACCVANITTSFFLVEEYLSMVDAKKQMAGRTKKASERALAHANELYYKVLPRFNHICCITAELEQFVRSRLGLDSTYTLTNIRRNDESSARPQLRERDGNEEPRELRLLYSGRINFSRDEFETLFSALSIAVEKDLPFKLDIFGRGNVGEERRIKQSIEDHNLSGWVVLHGFVSNEVLASAQLAADICLLLKAEIDQNRYNFPTKLMDYLDLSKPVVMTRIATHQHYFTDRENAIFVAPGSAESLFEGLYFAWGHRGEAREIGRRGREVLLSRFSAERVTAKYLDYLHA